MDSPWFCLNIGALLFSYAISFVLFFLFLWDCLTGPLVSCFVSEAWTNWPKKISCPCEGRHTECYQTKEAKGLNTSGGFRLLHSTNIECLPIEALYFMLGINTGQDVVLVSILLSYINHGSPINLSWVFFFYKYFTYYLLLLGQHIRKVLAILPEAWRPLFSQRSFEKGCCWNWRNVQYFKNGRSDSEAAWPHWLVSKV